MKTPIRARAARSAALQLSILGLAAAVGLGGCGESEGSSTTAPPSPPSTSGAAKATAPSGAKRFSVKPGAIKGYVDNVDVKGSSVILSGWAASSDLEHVASGVAGKVAGKTVAEAVPALERPDVIEYTGHSELKDSGFELSVPRGSLRCSAPAAGLTVFGTLSGIGSPLTYAEGTKQKLAEAC